MTEEMGLFKEALITLGAVVVAVLNIMSFFMIDQIHFLEEFFRADLKSGMREGSSTKLTYSYLATEFWLFQVHLAVGEETSSGLENLSAIGTGFIGNFYRLDL